MHQKPLYDVRHIADLKDMMEQSGNLYGSRNAFLLKTKDDNYKGITYADFKNDVDALGTALTNLGLKNGYIALIGENRYEWCVTYLAVVNGTGVIVPMDKELPFSEIENLLVRSRAAAVVYSDKFENDMKKICNKIPSVSFFINMDSGHDDQRFLSFRQLVEKGRELISSGDRSFLDASIDRDCMNILLFTSGTTDLAKGVMLSHRNICTDIMAVCSVLYIDSSDSVLSILPLHHTYECTCGFLVMVCNGCTISFTEGLKHIAKNLKEVKPSILLAVPLILEGMYKKIWEQAAKKRGLKTKLKIALSVSNFLYGTFKLDMRKKLFRQVHESIGGRIRLVISGAAAINPDVSKGFRSMGISVLQGYGLTECSPIVTVNREEYCRDDSIGLPLPCTQVKIDSFAGSSIGEILVKGDNVMLGYFENKLATEKVFKDDWFCTGDLGYMNDDGFFFITGRKKNVIVTKNGKNIYPEEVEAYLDKSPYILESLVFGKYDGHSGEVHVNAQIYPDIEAIRERLKTDAVSADEIHKLIGAEVRNINKIMPLYKHIRHFTIREEEFAKTTTRKIKRYMEKTG